MANIPGREEKSAGLQRPDNTGPESTEYHRADKDFYQGKAFLVFVHHKSTAVLNRAFRHNHSPGGTKKDYPPVVVGKT